MHIPLPDFDVLVALHRHDPSALEDFRRHVLRKAVDCAPLAHRASLEQLLERMETARAAAGSPMEAAMIAFRMMQDSVEKLHGSWEQALEAAAELQAAVVIARLRGNSPIGTA